MKDDRIKVGSIVQIDPAYDPAFGACLLTVTEMKSFGVMGFVRVPERPEAVEAYYRVAFEHIAYIGESEWAPKEAA